MAHGRTSAGRWSGLTSGKRGGRGKYSSYACLNISLVCPLSFVSLSFQQLNLNSFNFRYGALVRIQELCQLAAFPPQQVVLYHCEVEEVTGDFVPLPPPKSSCKHSATPRVHIQDLPRAGGDQTGREASEHQPVAGSNGVSGSKYSLPGGASFDLILCVRFLHRALNGRLSTLLARGGYVLYNTFLDMPGTQAFGRPKGDQHLLQPGELGRTWFGSQEGFRVVTDEVEVDEQSGRELSLFIAKLESQPANSS